MADIILVRGQSALVDDDDLPIVSPFRWMAVRCGRGDTLYARSTCDLAVYMHRLILDAPQRVLVDHRNGNGLDNRRVNIRLCSKSQNNVNKPLPRSATGYRGVTNNHARWQARIGKEGTKLGTYDTPKEAALAFDSAARERWGSFARLNFPGPGELPAFCVSA